MYAETLRERLLLDCRALLEDAEEAYATPLAELSKALVRLLAPASLSPLDAQNALLQLERAYADGLAELEQAGHRVEGLSVYSYLHKLDYVGRRRETAG